jgi:SAM-dependent methyltransferase
VLRRRLDAFATFLASRLPPPPARVLEVGCGSGELAVALAAAGYDVTAIKPEAPDGPIFRRVRLEEFSDAGGFDAVVASTSLHHVADLEGAVDRLAELLRRGGLLVLEEFVRERLAGPTAHWFHGQRLALAALGREDATVPADFEDWQRELAAHYDEHVHPFAEIEAALARRFAEREREWIPYLYDYHLDDALEPLERALIATGELAATGVRYVGVTP